MYQCLRFKDLKVNKSSFFVDVPVVALQGLEDVFHMWPAIVHIFAMES